MSVTTVPVLEGVIHSPDKQYQVMWWSTGVLACLHLQAGELHELFRTETSDPRVWHKIRQHTGLGADGDWVEAEGAPKTSVPSLLKIVNELFDKLGPCTCRDCTMRANARFN